MCSLGQSAGDSAGNFKSLTQCFLSASSTEPEYMFIYFNHIYIYILTGIDQALKIAKLLFLWHNNS